MKIFKGFSITTLPKLNFRLLQRHNMTKMRNKIPAKISDFTIPVFGFALAEMFPNLKLKKHPFSVKIWYKHAVPWDL
jgi:hypothetical protein